MTDDLVVWLREQLDEDERVARVAGEAKRRILDLAESATQRMAMKAGYDTVARLEKALAKVTAPELERVLRLLALPYADRPGFREEWRPEGIDRSADSDRGAGLPPSAA